MLDLSYKDFTIRKKNGKTRKISAPSKDLLKEQRKVLRSKLVPYYRKLLEDSIIYNVPHGFIPGRNVATAAIKHIGYSCTIMLDISDFFNSVYKTAFIDTISNEKLLFHKDGYCAQGFATSPMLANIASIPMLQSIHKALSKVYSDFAFTIYADDIQVSLQTDEHAMVNKAIDIITVCIENAGFVVNKNKTRVKYAKYGWRRILGINVGDTEIRATRKTMRKIRAARHQGNRSSLGGLVNWSRCNFPNKHKGNKDG